MDYRKDLEELALLREAFLERTANDSLFTFHPYPKQKAFIESVLGAIHYENWFCAANRCLAPWTYLETGSATRQISELIGEKNFDVLSWDGANRCTKKASRVFLKGIEPAFRFHLDNGEVFEATYKHRVLTPFGWVSLGSLLSIQDDLRSMEISEDYQASCDRDDRRYGQQLRRILDSGIVKFQPEAYAPPNNRLDFGKMGVAAPTPERIRACLKSFRRSKPDDPDLIAALCDLWTTNCDSTIDPRLSCQRPISIRFHDESIQTPEDHEFPSIQDQDACSPSYCCLPYPIPLLGNVMLIGYQKIGLQPIVDFEVSDTHCYVAGGIIHHNSGKSEAGCYVGACLARFGHDPKGYSLAKGSDIEVLDRATSGWVSSVTFPESRDIIQPKLFDNGFCPPGSREPFIPKREIEEWRVSDKILKLKNGSIIGFKSTEGGVAAYQGVEKDWIHFDEEHPRNIYNEACIRVGAGKRLRVFGTATLLPPEGRVGGVTWVYSDILKPFLDDKRKDVGCFSASIYDNPFLLADEIARLEARYPPESTEGRIRLGGEWLPGLSGARAYPSFDARLHVRKQPKPQQRRPLCWIWDFNVEPMVSLVGQKEGRLFRIYKELTLDEGNIGEMCQMFAEAYPLHYGEIWVYGDATGKGRNAQTGMSSYRIIQNAMRTYGAPLRLKVPEQNPLVPDRLNAVNTSLKDESGQINVEIDPSCEELIKDLEEVLRDGRGGIKKTFNRTDSYSRRTHLSDALGYWVVYEAPIRRVVDMEQYRTQIKQPSYGFSQS